MNRKDPELDFAAEYTQLRKSVTCSICLSVFRDPVSLPCTHSFCENCISKALQVRSKCPICSALAKKRNFRREEHLDDTLDLFRRLISVLDKSMKSRTKEEVEPTPITTSLLKPSRSADSLLSVLSPSEDDPELARVELEHNVPVPAGSSVIEAVSLGEMQPIGSPVQELLDGASSAEIPSQVPMVEAQPEGEYFSTTEAAPVPPEYHPVASPVVFATGALVNVLPRTWAGINKLGGVAWVEDYQLHNDGSLDGFYRVKFVLDGHVEDHVPACFVEKFEELSRGCRRARVNATTASSTDSPARVRGSLQSPPSSRKKSALADAVPATEEKASARKQSQSSAGKENRASASSSSSKKPSSISGHKRQRNLVLLTTCIDDTPASGKGGASLEQSLAQLASLSTNETITIVSKFSDAVTHLVVSVDRAGVMKQRTMKYMQALAHGLWIVSTRWVTESAKAGALLPEEDYEVKSNLKALLPQAPQRARIAAHLPPEKRLFGGWCILFDGLFPLPGPPRSELEQMTQCLGARVFTSVPEFTEMLQKQRKQSSSSSSPPGECFVVVRSTQTVHQEDSFSQDAQPVHSFSNTPVVTALWIMDTVTNFEIQPLQHYIVQQ